MRAVYVCMYISKYRIFYDRGILRVLKKWQMIVYQHDQLIKFDI